MYQETTVPGDRPITVEIADDHLLFARAFGGIVAEQHAIQHRPGIEALALSELEHVATVADCAASPREGMSETPHPSTSRAIE